MKRISIIVPIYNVEKYLAKCVESILSQTYSHLEIILVNDGSTDQSTKIIDKYAAIDKRIKIIHKQNGGLSDARNKGYDLVTGDYLMFIDSDDLVSSDFCEKMCKAALLHDADIVECSFKRFEDEKELKNFEADNKVKELDAEQALELLMREQLKQVVWNKIYKVGIVDSLHFEKGKTHEDEFWTYQIFGRAKKIVKIPDVLYFYRQQNDSIMAQKYSFRRLDGLEAREQRISYIASKFPKLTNVAVQTFWYSAFHNYQALTRNHQIDPYSNHREIIIEKVRKNVKPQYYLEWKIKDRLWLKFFLTVPKFCSRLRNFVGVGV